MFTSIGIRLPGALLVLGLLLAPLPGASQVTEAAAQHEANQRHDWAMAMATGAASFQLGNLSAIARLHAEAASLRDWDDPRARECWWLQGALLYGLGEHDDALVYFEKAAQHALANHDHANAANTFLDSALVLEEQGRTREAQELIRRAHDMTLVDEIPISERRRIQQRITIR
jgi:tetratricopeptide (TPR) repeat protein